MSNFCRVPQQMGRGGIGICQWPRNHTVTWNVVASLPNFPIPDLQEIYKSSFDLWSAVSGFKHKFVSNPRAANLIEGARAIDRQGGILAEHQLPCGNVTATSQLQGWFDTREIWTTATNWQGTGRMPLPVVAVHEFGHGIGLGHNEDGVTNSIMDPSISNISTLQPWEIDQSITRYGSPGPTPDDPDEDPQDLLSRLLDCLSRLDTADIKAIRQLFLGD